MWQDALWGVGLGLIPAGVAGFFVGRYAMYLAKLGRSRLQVSMASLVLLVLLGFSFTCLVAFGVLFINSHFRPWLDRGGLIGLLAIMGLVWLRLVIKLVRYQASYFIEYTYPRQTIIRGVPLFIAALSVFSFWRSGLIEVAAEVAAQKARNPAFCRAVRDKDHCQEQFYDKAVLKGASVDPQVCRSLSGSHVIRCLLTHHPSQPDVASCKAIRAKEGEDAAAYYWCLSYLPKTKEKRDACRRAEGSSHWVNLYFGGCLNEGNLNNKIESGKTVLMQFLEVKYLSEQAGGNRKLGVKHPIAIQAQLSSLLTPTTELEKTDREGRTLLFYVHSKDDLQAILDQGVRVNHQDQNGMTAAMHWLSGPKASQYQPHLEMLASKGVEINTIDKKGRSALSHFLLSFREQTDRVKNAPESVSTVETLLRLGANPYIRDKLRKRPVDYAKELNLTEIQSALRNYRDYRVQP